MDQEKRDGTFIIKVRIYMTDCQAELLMRPYFLDFKMP